MRIRPLESTDYGKQYVQLLNVLTGEDKNNKKKTLSLSAYQEILDSLNPCHRVLVVEKDNLIIATMTVLIERKFIHGGSKVLHVEDVIVHPFYQKQGIGKKLVQEALRIAVEEHCYKTILDCSRENIPFYESCGFQNKQCQMSVYH